MCLDHRRREKCISIHTSLFRLRSRFVWSRSHIIFFSRSYNINFQTKHFFCNVHVMSIIFLPSHDMRCIGPLNVNWRKGCLLWYWFFVQGVECFDYSHTLNVICTGGVDHAVRLWNPYVTVKPVAIMKGHQSSIIDLAIHEALEQVFSYDKDGVRNKKNNTYFTV